jgi:hypothetical protein
MLLYVYIMEWVRIEQLTNLRKQPNQQGLGQQV